MKKRLLCASFFVSLFYCFPVFGGCWTIEYDPEKCPCSLPKAQFDTKTIVCGGSYCSSGTTCMPNGTCCKEPDREVKNCCKFGVSTSTGKCCEQDSFLCTDGFIIEDDGCAKCCDYGTNKDGSACCEVDPTTCENGYITKGDGCTECCPSGSSTTGEGMATSVAGCLCNDTTYVWKETECVKCPSGSSTNGTGDETNVTGCKCDKTGAVWNETECVECPSGSSINGTGDETNVKDCLCDDTTYVWNETECVACPDGSSKEGLGGSTGIGTCKCEKKGENWDADKGCLCDYGVSTETGTCCEKDPATCTNGSVQVDGCAECCADANGVTSDGKTCCPALSTPNCPTMQDSDGCNVCQILDCTGLPDGTACVTSSNKAGLCMNEICQTKDCPSGTKLYVYYPNMVDDQGTDGIEYYGDPEPACCANDPSHAPSRISRYDDSPTSNTLHGSICCPADKPNYALDYSDSQEKNYDCFKNHFFTYRSYNISTGFFIEDYSDCPNGRCDCVYENYENDGYRYENTNCPCKGSSACPVQQCQSGVVGINLQANNVEGASCVDTTDSGKWFCCCNGLTAKQNAGGYICA